MARARELGISVGTASIVVKEQLKLSKDLGQKSDDGNQNLKGNNSEESNYVNLKLNIPEGGNAYEKVSKGMKSEPLERATCDECLKCMKRTIFEKDEYLGTSLNIANRDKKSLPKKRRKAASSDGKPKTNIKRAVKKSIKYGLTIAKYQNQNDIRNSVLLSTSADSLTANSTKAAAKLACQIQVKNVPQARSKLSLEEYPHVYLQRKIDVHANGNNTTGVSKCMMKKNAISTRLAPSKSKIKTVSKISKVSVFANTISTTSAATLYVTGEEQGAPMQDSENYQDVSTQNISQDNAFASKALSVYEESNNESGVLLHGTSDRRIAVHVTKDALAFSVSSKLDTENKPKVSSLLDVQTDVCDVDMHDRYANRETSPLNLTDKTHGKQRKRGRKSSCLGTETESAVSKKRKNKNIHLVDHQDSCRSKKPIIGQSKSKRVKKITRLKEKNASKSANPKYGEYKNVEKVGIFKESFWSEENLSRQSMQEMVVVKDLRHHIIDSPQIYKTMACALDESSAKEADIVVVDSSQAIEIPETCRTSEENTLVPFEVAETATGITEPVPAHKSSFGMEKALISSKTTITLVKQESCGEEEPSISSLSTRKVANDLASTVGSGESYKTFEKDIIVALKNINDTRLADICDPQVTAQKAEKHLSNPTLYTALEKNGVKYLKGSNKKRKKTGNKTSLLRTISKKNLTMKHRPVESDVIAEDGSASKSVTICKQSCKSYLDENVLDQEQNNATTFPDAKNMDSDSPEYINMPWIIHENFEKSGSQLVQPVMIIGGNSSIGPNDSPNDATGCMAVLPKEKVSDQHCCVIKNSKTGIPKLSHSESADNLMKLDRKYLITNGTFMSLKDKNRKVLKKKTSMSNSSITKVRSHSELLVSEVPCDNDLQSFSENAPEIIPNLELISGKGSITPENSFECICCARTFSKQSGLTEHSLVHIGSKFHICHYCGRAFMSKKSLNQHRIIHKIQDGLRKGEKAHKTESKRCRKFNCQHCGQNALSKSEFVIHTKSSKRGFSCRICTQVFLCKGLLRQHHINAHKTATTNIACSECGQQFFKVAYLDNHMSIHRLKYVQYVCIVCGAFFQRKTSLKNHIVTHSDSGLACLCEICGHPFPTRNALKNHKKIHRFGPLLYNKSPAALEICNNLEQRQNVSESPERNSTKVQNNRKKVQYEEVDNNIWKKIEVAEIQPLSIQESPSSADELKDSVSTSDTDPNEIQDFDDLSNSIITKECKRSSICDFEKQNTRNFYDKIVNFQRIESQQNQRSNIRKRHRHYSVGQTYSEDNEPSKHDEWNPEDGSGQDSRDGYAAINRKLKCKICSKSYFNAYSLTRHMQITHRHCAKATVTKF